jgi:hypothetical protein
MQSQQNAKQSEEIRFKWRHLTDLDFEIELRSTNKILQLINQLNKYWGITVLMLDDKCKFYQIYNVCSFPAPKEKEKVNIGTVRNAPAIPDNYIILPVTSSTRI